MKTIYCDNRAKRARDSFKIILLTGGWHVVATGYLCKVADAEEGRRVIAALQTAEGQEMHLIDNL